MSLELQRARRAQVLSLLILGALSVPTALIGPATPVAAQDTPASASRGRAELVRQRILPDGKVERTVRLHGGVNSFRDAQGEWRGASQEQTAPRAGVLAYADNPINVEFDYQTGALTTVVPGSGSTTTMTLATINGQPVAYPWAPEPLADGAPGILVRNVAPYVDWEVRVMSDRIKQNLVVRSAEGLDGAGAFTAAWDYARRDTGTNDLRWLPPTVTFARPTPLAPEVPIAVTDTGTRLTYTLSYDGSYGWPLIVDPTETVGENTNNNYMDNFHDNRLISASGSENANTGGETFLQWFRGAAPNLQRIIMRGDFSDIPSNAIVTSASLYVYHWDPGCSNHTSTWTVPVHQILPANAGWVEGTRTASPWEETGSSCWNDHTYQDTQEWAGSPGLSTAGTDYNATAEGSLSFDTATGYKSVSVTDLVQGWIDGSIVNAGVILLESNIPETSGATTYALRGVSSEGTNSNRPYFEVTYTTPPGTGLAVQEGGVTVSSNTGILDFGATHFDITESPDNEVNITLSTTVSHLGSSIEGSEIAPGTIAASNLATALDTEIDDAEEVTSGAADPPALAAGVLYVETDEGALWAGDGANVRDVADRRFTTFFSTTAVTEGGTVVNLPLPNGWNAIHIVELTVTPTSGGTDVDVHLHRKATGGTGDADVWARYENWDASAGNLVDSTGLYYRDMDDTGELHVTIDAIAGGPGTYTITVTGYGLERLVQ